MGRSKREHIVKATGENLNIVTYRILAGDQIYPVDVVNPSEYIPLDTIVKLSVSYPMLCWQVRAAFTLTQKQEKNNGEFLRKFHITKSRLKICLTALSSRSVNFWIAI